MGNSLNLEHKNADLWIGRVLFVLLWLFAAGNTLLWGQDHSTRNQFSAGLTAYGADDLPAAELNLLWQPEISLSQPLNASLSLGVELSAQNRISHIWDNTNELHMESDLYRYLLKLEGPQSELRLGLQRLNFGSAQLLRPLQWFDSLKPLDSLEQTSGVEALLLRQYFNNNSNLWLWAMLANDELKGNESISSKPDTPEWGGRFQFPNPLGETAFSFHTRELADALDHEYRLGFDHRLDSFVGAWLELAGNKLPAQAGYQLSACLGTDYTVGIGSGLAITLETMNSFVTDENLANRQDLGTQTALLLSYPLGLLDSMMMLGLWNWKENQSYINMLWRRTYDLLSLELKLSLDSGIAPLQSRSPALSFNLIYNL